MISLYDELMLHCKAINRKACNCGMEELLFHFKGILRALKRIGVGK